jgi:hypothetical protein
MRLFSTVIHSFAQGSRENVIDAANESAYLAPQIEPEAWRLNGSVQMSRLLNRFRDSELTGKFKDFADSAQTAQKLNGDYGVTLNREVQRDSRCSSKAAIA